MMGKVMKVRMTEEFMEQLFTRDSEGNKLSVEWGESGAGGFYVPTIHVDYDDNIVAQFEAKNKELREALEEQLGLRGYAYRGRCDGVPDDVRRAFVAISTPCDEIDKQSLIDSAKSLPNSS